MTKVLVTGWSGFIGKNLVPELEREGIEVCKFSGRIDDYGSLEHYENENIDHVIHLAAKTYVPDSWEYPIDFYKTNVIGTLAVLGFCSKTKANLTFMSSYLYGDKSDLPTKETCTLSPTNPYALSKLAAEDACRFYAKYHDLGIAILRPFNIYGEGQSRNFLIPSIIEKALDEKSTEIVVQDLKPQRDFIHVSDLTALILKTVTSTIENGTCESYNVGSGVPTSIGQLISIVQGLIKSDKKVSASGDVRQGEISVTQADITKSFHTYGWSPKITIEEGLKRLVNASQQPHP